MSFFPGIVTKNWQLKAAALAMAVLLWTVPRFEGQSSQTLQNVPVTVDLSDLDWARVGEPSPPMVNVTVSGPARELIALGIDPPAVVIPMTDLSSGDTTVMLRPSWFRGYGRPGVVVEDLRPGAVHLTFEEVEQRPIPLAARLTGQLPQGLSRSGQVVITPRETAVFGPASRLQAMDSVRLVPFDLSRVSGEGSHVVPVDTAGLEGLRFLNLEATLEVPVETTMAREFTDRPLVLPPPDSGPPLQARPASVRVVLVGARSLVENLDPETIIVSIPANQATLAPGEEVRVGVEVEGVPEFVDYRVTPDWVLLRRPAGL